MSLTKRTAAWVSLTALATHIAAITFLPTLIHHVLALALSVVGSHGQVYSVYSVYWNSYAVANGQGRRAEGYRVMSQASDMPHAADCCDREPDFLFLLQYDKLLLLLVCHVNDPPSPPNLMPQVVGQTRGA